MLPEGFRRLNKNRCRLPLKGRRNSFSRLFADVSELPKLSAVHHRRRPARANDEGAGERQQAEISTTWRVHRVSGRLPEHIDKPSGPRQYFSIDRRQRRAIRRTSTVTVHRVTVRSTPAVSRF
jgi:hypothetical protein